MKNIQAVNGNAAAMMPKQWEKHGKKSGVGIESLTSAEDPAASFVKNDTAAMPQTYKADTDMISALRAEADRQHAALRDMVSRLLHQQGLTAQDVWNSFQNKTELQVEVDQAARDKAAALIGEDGELGWKKVSENILNFAKALSGGDPAHIDKLQRATERAFAIVEKKLGNLPEVTQKTIEAVRRGFDEWRAEAAGSSASANEEVK
jgi:hypothetical protein